ncbi:GGDEF domain-containing protein [Bacillus sp. FJAT-50079]|uniref:GGDEF domain-containing protein n=1 Tax=Bacillus sp. FJAT-50079 TaxID=2833577 RepID=UPI001BC8E46E|nr:GGDEF domain-containing protein [Bacillus sp. FJAT-50079]MBS4208954.1 GGDEF domain-containing protein [Bacillus sp. FJAT-50079]
MPKRNFQLQITVLLIAFSLFITFVIAFIDHNKLKSRVIEEHKLRLTLAESTILTSLHTVDKAYHLFDDELANKMKKNSERWLAYYTENPNVDQWDMDALKEEFGMDVYIINDKNVIIRSSFKEDIGLDFQNCCVEFSKVLDKRRNGHIFADDGLDVQQKTGELKKFSYMPTPDHKYLLQLGYALDDEHIFNEFNVWKVIADLETSFDFLYKILIRNSEGYVLRDRIEAEMPADRLAVFQQTVDSGVTHEIDGTWNNKAAKYRYLPYKADEERGISTNRVVEIAYHENELNRQLSKYKNEFIIQLLVILTIALFISFIIFRWVAKPMHLAFHDSLTGLKNRAAFEEIVEERLKRKDHPFALMMIDLDNFKLVNDHLGHSEGDQLLIVTADTIQHCIGKDNIPARLGGDEFIVVFPQHKEQDITEISSLLIHQIRREIKGIIGSDHIDVTVSIGIAFSEEGDSLNTLYEKADIALYESKKRGKNQYQVYGENTRERYG